MGHRVAERDKEIATLKAKLETKDKLLQDALKKIKGIYEDSTEKEEDQKEISEDEE